MNGCAGQFQGWRVRGRVRRRLTPFFIAAVILLQVLQGQADGVFRGTLETEDGSPVIGASVFVADNGGRKAPSSALTDDDGRFEVRVEPGQSFCTWAIGKPDSEGACWIIRPSYVAAAGVDMAWTVTAQSRPEQIRLRGVGDYVSESPLKLCVMVSRDSVAVEIPVDSDGFLELPPLPASAISLLLVDGDGHVLVERHVDLMATREIALGPVSEMIFRVVDDKGNPLPGVQVLELRYHTHPLAAPLRAWSSGLVAEYVLGTSDEKGVAKCRVASTGKGDFRRFYGRKAGYVSAYSGYIGQASFEGLVYAPGVPDGPMQLQMSPETRRSLTISGAPDDAELTAFLEGDWYCADSDGFRMAESPTISAEWPIRDGRAEGSVFSAGLPQWRVYGSIKSEPNSVVSLSVLSTGEEAMVMWPSLRRIRVRVTDASGTAIPFATVGIVEGQPEMPPSWHHVRLADENGLVTFILNGATGDAWSAYACTPAAHGVTEFRLDSAVDVGVELRPYSNVEVLVTNGSGSPVKGAAITMRMIEFPGAGLETFAMDAAMTALFGKVTDAGGRFRCKLPRELNGKLAIKARLLGAFSKEATLNAGTLNLILQGDQETGGK